jgi:hypothetical protein
MYSLSAEGSCRFYVRILHFIFKEHSQKHKNTKTYSNNFNGHKNTNLCLFNPIFNPIICMSVIKTQICRTSPPRCANLCPDISLTYFYFPRENFIFRLDVTPAARRLRTSSHAAATTAFVARCLSPPPPPPAPLPHTTAADTFSDNNGETVVPSRGRLFNFSIHVLRPLIFHLATELGM